MDTNFINWNYKISKVNKELLQNIQTPIWYEYGIWHYDITICHKEMKKIEKKKVKKK